jgi:hypothetical protein
MLAPASGPHEIPSSAVPNQTSAMNEEVMCVSWNAVERCRILFIQRAKSNNPAIQ